MIVAVLSTLDAHSYGTPNALINFINGRSPIYIGCSLLHRHMKKQNNLFSRSPIYIGCSLLQTKTSQNDNYNSVAVLSTLDAHSYP